MTAFEEMGIMPEIGKAVEEMGWLLPTDIQSEAIPLILGGGDVLMAAETGSGKTGAFSLPVVQIVWETRFGTKEKKVKPSERWLLSSMDRDPELGLDSTLLSAQSRDPKRWQGVRSNKGVKKSAKVKRNKFYYVVHFDEAGLARVGWSIGDGALDLGTCKNGWGYGATGKKSNSKNFENYGTTFGEKFDKVGCVLDLESGEISFYKNGENLGIAFRIPSHVACQNTFYPTICCKNAACRVQFEPEGDEKAPDGAIWVSQAHESQFFDNPRTIGTSGRTSSKDSGAAPYAIIIEPSRELAQQTFNCIESFKQYLPQGKIRTIVSVGGVSVKQQIDDLAGGMDIVVATPGRLQELINSGAISLRQCHFFILDEVDGLLQQGNSGLITDIHDKLPRMFPDGRRLQMIVCSATLHNFDVKKLAEKLMYFPNWVDLKGEDSVPDTVHHVVLRINPQDMLDWKSFKNPIVTDGVHARDRLNYNDPNAETLSEAVKLLKGHYAVKAIDALKMDKGIIFCRTKLDCDNLENYMNKLGGGPNNPKNPYSCVCLHSDRGPKEREANLNKFKNDQVKFLICTDVAARGIDIKGIPFVIQVTLPDEKANYLHRIGRVGRAERMGLAVSLVATVPEKVWYHANCNTRGKNCFDTRLVEQKGCCIWYNEHRLLGEIEEHLNCTIPQIDTRFEIQADEFDGKVVYGAKRAATAGYNYETHVSQLEGVVKNLGKLEAQAQLNYLNMYSLKKICT